MKKQKFYVVWQGVVPGIYDNWPDCQKQVKNFASAQYKSFDTLSEAEEAYLKRPTKTEVIRRSTSTAPESIINKSNNKIIVPSLSVDAACSGNPGLMEYRGVWTSDKTELFHQGPFKEGTNNIGEFLALVHGLAYLQNNHLGHIPIYTDSKTAKSWVSKKFVKTTLTQTAANEVLFTLIERALDWLKKNQYSTPILKWETEKWGEIPADFGRK